MSETRQITDPETNPLLKAWVTPFAAPPFDEIEPARSLVLHAEHTRTAAARAGTAGPRVACLTLGTR